MTCIVGVEHKKYVYIGGDSTSISNWDHRETALEKVFAVGELLIGYTSSFRMGQLLQFSFEPREQQPGEADLEYLVTGFVPALRKCLSDGGFAKIEHSREEGGRFLLGYRGKLYSVQEDFQVNRTSFGFNAVGAGACFAMGALGTMRITNPEAAVLKALRVATRFSIGVRGPYYVKSI